MIRIENATKELKEGLQDFFDKYQREVKAVEVFDNLFDITISEDVPVIIKHSNTISDSITLNLGTYFFEVPKADMYKFSII
jgi:hypothetical protein